MTDFALSPAGRNMQESSSPITSQTTTLPLHAKATVAPSEDATDDSSDTMMGGLFSKEYMNMEKPSIVLQQPFQFGAVMDAKCAIAAASADSRFDPASLVSIPLQTTVSYCNLFESYAVEPLPSQMACISENEDDTHSQSNTSHSHTIGSVAESAAARTTSTTSLASPNSFAVSTNLSFLSSAPSFVASAHDPWATLSDHTAIITAAATATTKNSSSKSNIKNDLANSASHNTLHKEDSPQKKRTRHSQVPDHCEEVPQHHSVRRLHKRHTEKGVFTFRENGEYELMMHVQRGSPANFNRLSPLDSSNLILNVIDVYCREEQWMFHIGQEKGHILKGFLKECIRKRNEEHRKKSDSMEDEAPQEQPPLIIVEVGTYCGYSAILLAKSLHELDPRLKFRIYTVETNSQYIMVANSMILMSKFHEDITILHHQPALESMASLLQRKMKNPPSSSSDAPHTVSVSSESNGTAISPSADFVFFDHDKERYVEHLKEFEYNRIIRKGTFVAADNVLFHRLDAYRLHMTKLQRRGVTQTKMVQVSLEYCEEEDDVRDGIELSTYLKDPA